MKDYFDDPEVKRGFYERVILPERARKAALVASAQKRLEDKKEEGKK